MKTFIKINPDGKVETFAGDFDLQGAERRVSHIRPQNFVLRLLFILLRKLFSDKGKIAEWTRTWKVTWQIEIIEAKQIYKGFENRQRAIEFERKLITNLKIKSYVQDMGCDSKDAC